jgi:hypothetical protein
MVSPRVYRWIRDLHLYLGLFISPFVLVFALSVIFLNHTWLPWGSEDRGEEGRRSVTVSVPEGEDNLELAKQIQRQIGVTGEIDFISRNLEKHRLSFPIKRPGEHTTVRVDLASGTTQIEQQETGVWDAMIYLHKMPGPHNVAVRGNWIFTRVWGWLADATVYLLLFLTASGVYLWSLLKAERKAGLIFLGSGVLSFLAIAFAIVG